MPDGKPEVLQGTLDLMVLKTLESLGPLRELSSRPVRLIPRNCS